VIVLERRANVSQESSFGNSGLVAPAHAASWAAPGMPRHLLGSLFKTRSPLRFHAKPSLAMWRWLRRWLDECKLHRYQARMQHLHRLASYSLELLQQLRAEHDLHYEQNHGLLQLFRHPEELRLAGPALDWLKASGAAHRLLDADAARALEPGLSPQIRLAGALHLPNAESGNCPLFTRHLRQLAQQAGAGFHFHSEVERIAPQDGRIDFWIAGQRHSADALVVAAGNASTQLLRGCGVRLPCHPVKEYSATVAIRNFDHAPNAMLVDEGYRVSMTRMGNRMRLTGATEFGFRSEQVEQKAVQALIRTGHDWFPGAADFSNASLWSGVRPMLPDDLPLLGPTAVANLYLNLGAGAANWSSAVGSGKILADLISGRAADIDTTGLTLSRYQDHA